MTDLTAAEVQVLAALMDHHPMTRQEVVRSVADRGMHLGDADVAAAVRSLADHGMTERTPVASLGKYRITAKGRAWIASSAAPPKAG